jgi:hypothetical protein
MPILKNVKHEAFAQQMVRGLALGWSPADAYGAAGYKPSSRHAAENCAARLLGNVGIRDRVSELQAVVAKKTTVTVASLIEELELARAAAHDDKQFSAVTQAIVAKARISGKWIDRVEHGAPGAFDRCESLNDILNVVLADYDDPRDALAGLDELRAALVDRIAGRAKPIEHVTLLPK